MSKIISVNAGSSSLKFQLFEMDDETVITSGVIERIGLEDSIFTIKYNGEKDVTTLPIENHKVAVQLLLDTLIKKEIVKDLDEIKGVGHRVVQGGAYFDQSVIIDEDVVSKIFLKVYRKLEYYDESRASLSTWIYSITRNTVIDYYKKRESQKILSFDEVAEIEEIPDELPADEELLEDLANALEKLSERERDLIILHYYRGYTLKRIAEMMGMSYINAKVIHAKVLSVLRKLLTN